MKNYRLGKKGTEDYFVTILLQDAFKGIDIDRDTFLRLHNQLRMRYCIEKKYPFKVAMHFKVPTEMVNNANSDFLSDRTKTLKSRVRKFATHNHMDKIKYKTTINKHIEDFPKDITTIFVEAREVKPKDK